MPVEPLQEFEITVDRLVYGGEGLSRRGGKVVFVPFSVPGDRLWVRPVENKKNYTRVETVRILEPGPGRILPVCPHFMRCGGCHWQQLDYARQVAAKRQILEEIFYHRFPQIRDWPIAMQACPQPFGYRSRARVQIRKSDDGTSLGFYRGGSHAVEDVENCPLLRPSLNKALSELRNLKRETNVCPVKQEMDIVCSEEDGRWAAAKVGSDNPREAILQRKVGDFVYALTASAFFQANDFMVSKLVSLVCTLSEGAGRDSAIDLFAGVGLFTLPLARQFKEVIAIEGAETARRRCSLNLSDAGFRNVRVIHSDVLQGMNSADSLPSPDLVLLDPPRTGAGIEVMNRICKSAPKTILYVSCDPQTLSRDIAQIAPFYRIDFIEGLDMFPQTYHFETVVRLKRL